jgi:NAD(P)-dependent dehydrogenase (short-subunit alcohol dehydrogenase family)
VLCEPSARRGARSAYRPRSRAIPGAPLGRIGEPEEIARAIVSLASEAASLVTGQVVTADGGKTAG